jgi:MFS family permease
LIHLYFVGFVFYFSFGALLPFVPSINIETAGWAFSTYYVFKTLWYIPAGATSDKLGHYNSLVCALVFQAIAILILWRFPQWVLGARMLEGMALAQSTVSSLSALRMRTDLTSNFSKDVNRLLLAGSIGFLFGPLFGFILAKSHPEAFLVALLLITLLCGVIIFGARSSNIALHGETKPWKTETSKKLIVGLASTKCILIGWQLNMVWWVSDLFGEGSFFSGGSFVLLGVFFAVGSIRPSSLDLPSGFAGLLCLELSLAKVPVVWWFSLIFFGYCFGSYIADVTGRLGWNDPNNAGRKNSFWLTLSDLPSAFIPIVLWQWKSPEFAVHRIVLATSLLLFAYFSLFGTRRFPFPIRSSRV